MKRATRLEIERIWQEMLYTMGKGGSHKKVDRLQDKLDHVVMRAEDGGEYIPKTVQYMTTLYFPPKE